MSVDSQKQNALFVALLTVGFIIASLYIFSPFLKYILVAAVLALSTSHGYNAALSAVRKSPGIPRWIHKSSRAIVALLFTSFFLLMIFLPLLYFISVTYDQAAALDIRTLKETALDMWTRFITVMSNIPILEETFQRLKTEGTSLINSSSIEAVIKGGENMISSVSGLVFQIAWILTFYFLFNVYGDKILHFLATLMPTSRKHESYLYKECTGTVAVVFYGTLFNMAAQGLAFGILMVFIGGYDSLYLGVLAGFCSIIPLIGSALVYIPVVALELFAGNYLNAAVILVFAFAVMGFFIDNILRLIFIGSLKKIFGFDYTMNEILILLSILAGIATLGFWGLIIGPSVVALTLAAANICRDYLAEEEHTPQTGC
ncbi:MAG: AI-2E family transporter [Desulfopila sp.]|jgi:predicted PurR-regulated permease PerM|nr:AI-2E family transporter [Desulfopila sp.]